MGKPRTANQKKKVLKNYRDQFLDTAKNSKVFFISRTNLKDGFIYSTRNNAVFALHNNNKNQKKHF